MESVLLSNPIYQHSGESEKISSIAQQAAVNEDQEQRRRQLDSKGEAQKKQIAREVAHMVDESGATVHLKSTPFEIPSEPLLQQAQHAATNAIQSTVDTAKSFLGAATDKVFAVTGAVTNATKGAAGTAVHLGQDAAGYIKGAADSAVHQAQGLAHQAQDLAVNAAHQAQDIAGKAAHQAQDIAGKAAHQAQDIAGKAAHQAQGIAGKAAHQAQDIAGKAASQAQGLAHQATDLASSAATTVSQKTKELAEGAANKAFEIADNINHFTTLVSVLAEEENERSRRLVSGDEARAAANAFRVSELIRDLGIAFYKQTPNLSYSTKILEEAERRWRLNSSHSALAESHAHSVGKLVSSNLQSFMPRYEWVRQNVHAIEEKERTRRLIDNNECYAILNALNISSLIRDLGLGFYRQEGTFSRTHAGYATTLLEENERRDRIRSDKLIHAEDSAHLLMDVVANNMEKFNYSTRHAAQFANEFANLLGTATKKVANSFAQATQDLAKNASTRVKAVASDLANFSAIMYVIALEEKERARRLSDPNEIIAINNAWIQSGLIRELEGLYRRPLSRAVFPARLIEEQERQWRLTSVKPAASRRLADMVNANLSKFELATQRLGGLEHARDVAAHSRLNPNAPTFVPHQGLMTKQAEPVQPISYKASGAQL